MNSIDMLWLKKKNQMSSIQSMLAKIVTRQKHFDANGLHSAVNRKEFAQRCRASIVGVRTSNGTFTHAAKKEAINEA